MSEKSLKSIIELLESDRWHVVRHFFKLRNFEQGTVIINQGTPSSSLMVLKSGEIEVSKNISGGGALILGKIQAKGHIGEMSMIDDQPSTVRAVASSDVECWVLDKAHYHALCVAFPWLNYHLMKILAKHAVDKNHVYMSRLINLLKRCKHLQKRYSSIDIKPAEVVSSYLYPRTKNILLTDLFKSSNLTDEEELVLRSYSKIVSIRGESLFEQHQSSSVYILLEGAVQLMHCNKNISLSFDVMDAGHVFFPEALIGVSAVSNQLRIREYAAFLKIDVDCLKSLKQERKDVYGKLYQQSTYSLIAQLRNIGHHLMRIASEGKDKEGFYIDF